MLFVSVTYTSSKYHFLFQASFSYPFIKKESILIKGLVQIVPQTLKL